MLMLMSTERPLFGLPDPLFRNITERNLSLDDVFARIGSFMRQKPCAEYRLIIGTDCQAHARLTTFVTGVVIQRVGNGAWACYRKLNVARPLRSVKQKLSCETSLSEQVAMRFGDAYRIGLENIVLPYVYQGASLRMYVDIDAGSDAEINKTAPLVEEMVRRVEALGCTARIKPDAIVASCYADRFTKRPEPEEAAGL